MKSDEELIARAHRLVEDAMMALELVCRRQRTCENCPINFGNSEGRLPSKENPCQYHELAITFSYGRAAKMCPTCVHFHEGGCVADIRENSDLDYEPACESYIPGKENGEE